MNKGFKMTWMAYLAVLTTAQAGPLLSPADAALAAAKDIGTVATDSRSSCRYLTVYNFPPVERGEAVKILSVHLNGLSREPELVIPAVVPGTEGSLLRIDIRDYGWDPKTWDKLGEFDTYFHVQLQRRQQAVIKRTTDENGHKWFRVGDGDWVLEYQNVNGQLVQKNKLPEPEKGEEVRALAPWLSRSEIDAKQLGYLAEATQSVSPILRADWFLRHTAVQEADKFGGKAPGYYDFLKIANQKDYEEALGLNLKLVRTAFKDETAAAVARSTVALNNRRLLRFGKIGGGAWFTLDAKENVGKQNYLRVLDTDRKAKTFLELIAQKDEYTATESFGPLPNGLMIWGLFNNEGEKQTNAPDFIASDGKAPGTDKRVHVNMSCIRCHVDGIQPIKDWVRRLVSNPLELKTPDYDAFKRARQLYTSDLEGKIKGDQLIYATAVSSASGGMTTEKFARAYALFWARYQETDFDVDRIALETGYTKEMVLKGLDGLVKKVGGIDPVVAGLLRAMANNHGGEIPIRSEQWEEVFPVFMTYMRGAVP